MPCFDRQSDGPKRYREIVREECCTIHIYVTYGQTCFPRPFEGG